MRISEYQSGECGKTIEVIQKMSDKPLKKHEGCGGARTKLISAAGFHFKGTGWYVTDYGRKGATEPKESREGSETKETKETKDSSSNGNKEGSGTKAGTEKPSRKESSSKPRAKKD